MMMIVDLFTIAKEEEEETKRGADNCYWKVEVPDNVLDGVVVVTTKWTFSIKSNYI